MNQLTEVSETALPADLQKRILERKLSPLLTSHIALRARKYDTLCRMFLEENPDGLVVSLGAGFDTRFWRLGGKNFNYQELDLPAVVQTKKLLLDEVWIQKEDGRAQNEKGSRFNSR